MGKALVKEEVKVKVNGLFGVRVRGKHKLKSYSIWRCILLLNLDGGRGVCGAAYETCSAK